jgi:leader peptidase (prepilin peptidase)/N-methyltransferase
MLAYIVGPICLILTSLALALLPHRLVVFDLEQPHPLRVELMLVLFLSLAGSLLFFFLLYQPGFTDKVVDLVECAIVLTLATLIYYDVRFFVIPDVYVIVLLAAAVVGPLAGNWRSALFGAGLCASLVGGVALVWRLRTGTDGMGFGDIKLAAALGGLLGAERGLWTISGAACVGAIVGQLFQMRQKRRGVDTDGATDTQLYVVPFGAALAAVGGVVLMFTTR